MIGAHCAARPHSHPQSNIVSRKTPFWICEITRRFCSGAPCAASAGALSLGNIVLVLRNKQPILFSRPPRGRRWLHNVTCGVQGGLGLAQWRSALFFADPGNRSRSCMDSGHAFGLPNTTRIDGSPSRGMGGVAHLPQGWMSALAGPPTQGESGPKSWYVGAHGGMHLAAGGRHGPASCTQLRQRHESVEVCSVPCTR